MQLILMNECAQRSRLFAGERCENQISFFVGIGARCFDNGGAFFQLIGDKVADTVFVVAGNHDGLAQHDILNDRIDQERF